MKTQPDTALPSASDVAAGAQAIGSELGEVWNSMSGLSLPIATLAEVQSAYLTQATELWNQTLHQSQGAAPAADRRFAAPAWAANPASAYTAQMYLLNAHTLMQMAEGLDGDQKTKQRIRFAVQQWIDASSPNN